MTDLVTQCPQCGTAFRATEEQLQAAHGAVRCGSCLHIFMAEEHRQSDSELTGTETSDPSINTVDTASNDPEPHHEEDDDLLISDTGVHAVISDDLLKEVDDIIGDADEDSFSDSFLDVGIEKPNTGLFSGDVDNETPIADDEAWAKDLLQELESEPEQGEPDEMVLDDSPSLDDELFSDEFTSLDEEFTLADESPEEETEFLISDEPVYAEDEAIDQDSNEVLLANIQPEPVIFADPDRQQHWRTVLWALLSVAGLIGLAGQYVHSNFDNLATHPNYRDSFETLCDVAGCELPPQIAVDKIRTTNLIVRSHPDIDQALIMDAILTNHALYSQPYPTIELRFTNLKAEIIAVGKFQPSDYLAGELLGSKSMASRQPIHVSLSVSDPGENAVNYQINLIPAQ